ncbi:hypothetical protein KIW84_057061 [Lathyrus oleraceus]|uniref:DUF659 domain-containing protein n=1 Tax=Pisum sativum TaxID=3888 RepID=A0A9D5AMA3_PEA|nr:hypothetical protein KIW84_057061 [Pisum sativum]
MASSSAVGTLVVGAFIAPPAIAPPPRQKKLPKNSPGNRTDMAWKHGIVDPDNPRKIQCKYCQKKSSQPSINAVLKKGLRDDACQAIARFFYNNDIPFNVARTEEFTIMCDMISIHGNGFKPPSYHDLRIKLLNQEIKLTHEALEEHRKEWRNIRCTIMTYGWTDRKRTTILNFLVNSPKGTVF